MAVCLLESTVGDEEERERRRAEAIKLMDKVPGLRQKIAGKSIPLEVRFSFPSVLTIHQRQTPHTPEIRSPQSPQVHYPGTSAGTAHTRVGLYLPGYRARSAERHRRQDAARSRQGPG